MFFLSKPIDKNIPPWDTCHEKYRWRFDSSRIHQAIFLESVMAATKRTPWQWHLDVPKHVGDLIASDKHI